MFISKEEKEKIVSSLEYIDYQNASFQSRINVLEKKIAELEKKPVVTEPPIIKYTKKPLTPLQKAKQRVYQMEYKQRAKAKKLEEQGKTNVSA
jgi:hypothetical protein